MTAIRPELDMDLEAARLDATRAWNLTRVSMVACFAMASMMLLASLIMVPKSNAGADMQKSTQVGPPSH